MVEITNTKIKEASDFKDDFIKNGLEHVFTAILDENKYPMKYLCWMFIVPERAVIRHFFITPNSMAIQVQLQEHIFASTGIPMHAETANILSIHDRTKQRNYRDIEDLNLSPLEKAKRHVSVKLVKNMYNNLFEYDGRYDLYENDYKNSKEIKKLNKLGKERRRYTGEIIRNALTNKLAEKSSNDKTDVLRICDLIAMWISVKTSSITYNRMNSDVCVIYDEAFEYYKYKPSNGKYVEVFITDHDVIVGELNEQLKAPLFEETNSDDDLD
ncbi:uncharacterized protein LOC126836761 [Adelges cooleyi]|uniref:uncharacterized protein LOC126836761 n=1 Tax=Adelges cooleyi TaxID=133065 RepID=UPI00217FDF5F|nr:uncharacterized protein LOC126836761 [Adelges cooleyi]